MRITFLSSSIKEQIYVTSIFNMGKNKSSNKKKPSSSSKSNATPSSTSKKREEENMLKQEALEKQKNDAIVMEDLRKDSQRLRNKCNQLNKRLVSHGEQYKEKTESMEEWKERFDQLLTDFDEAVKAESKLKETTLLTKDLGQPATLSHNGRELAKACKVLCKKAFGLCQRRCVLRMMLMVRRLITNVAIYWRTDEYLTDEKQDQIEYLCDLLKGIMDPEVFDD
jgi:hypothetical protein